MDNRAIARILREIADLLEIKDANPFKIRAYRNGADITSNHPHELALLDETGLREILGIGKDLAAKIRDVPNEDHRRRSLHEAVDDRAERVLIGGGIDRRVEVVHREPDRHHGRALRDRSGKLFALRLQCERTRHPEVDIRGAAREERGDTCRPRAAGGVDCAHTYRVGSADRDVADGIQRCR